MQALPCPKGAYKEGIDRAAVCTPCVPAGITTAGVASASATACDRATPGYRPVRSPAGDTILGVEPCPFGTFGPDGLQCITCADNLTTQATAHTSPADCLAAPGFGYYKDGQGDSQPISTADLQAAASKVVKCPSGSYKVRTADSSERGAVDASPWKCGNLTVSCPSLAGCASSQQRQSRRHTHSTARMSRRRPQIGVGSNAAVHHCTALHPTAPHCTAPSQAGWNLDACKSCGVNVLTDTNAFEGLGLSVDQCYLPPGWGASFDATTKKLVAYKCNNGSYGVAARTYGVEPRPCMVSGGAAVLFAPCVCQRPPVTAPTLARQRWYKQQGRPWGRCHSLPQPVKACASVSWTVPAHRHSH